MVKPGARWGVTTAMGNDKSVGLGPFDGSGPSFNFRQQVKPLIDNWLREKHMKRPRNQLRGDGAQRVGWRRGISQATWTLDRVHNREVVLPSTAKTVMRDLVINPQIRI